jgi:hypothetical protein
LGYKGKSIEINLIRIKIVLGYISGQKEKRIESTDAN